MTPVPNGCETPAGERAQRGTHTEATARSWRPASSDPGAPHSGRAALGRSGDARARVGFVFSGQSNCAKLITNPSASEISKYRSPHSASLSGVGERPFSTRSLRRLSTPLTRKITRTELFPRAAGYVGKIDNTLAGAHRCKGRIGPAIRDVEPKLLIESHRFAHITYRQRNCADVVDRPR
jgi:hypothetical protein